MPVEQTITVAIACDNPDCPGNELDPASRTGWLFVTHELYGEEPAAQSVFCCYGCLGEAGVARQGNPKAAPFGS